MKDRPKIGTYLGVYGHREPKDYQVQIEWLEEQLAERDNDLLNAQEEIKDLRKELADEVKLGAALAKLLDEARSKLAEIDKMDGPQFVDQGIGIDGSELIERIDKATSQDRRNPSAGDWIVGDMAYDD